MAEGVVCLIKAVLGKLSYYAADKTTATRFATKQFRKLESSLVMICPFIEDAENRQSVSDSIRLCAMDLKYVVSCIDDLVDEIATDAWRLRLKQSGKVGKCFSYTKQKLMFCFSVSNKIEETIGMLAKIRGEIRLVGSCTNEIADVPQSRERITYPLPVNLPIVGRDEDKHVILGKVLTGDVECCFGLRVLPIVGRDGLGKTTLAQLVYSDLVIDNHFSIKFWGCVSHLFDLNSLLGRLLESVNEASIWSMTWRQMAERFSMLARGKKYFMVLDDVWTIDNYTWKTLASILRFGAEGSVILATTNDTEVATKTMGVREYYNLERLPNSHAMDLFKRNAFYDEEEWERYPHLVKVGETIVKKCGGIPLAIETLGWRLRGERTEAEWIHVAETDWWNIDQREGDIFHVLKLRYNRLDPQLQLCFAYLSVFPKDHKLLAYDVIAMWIAQGLIKHDISNAHDELEARGYRYFEQLLSRSFLSEPTFAYNDKIQQCKMHDLLHDFAMSVMGEEVARVSCNDPKVSRFVRHMAWTNAEEEVPRPLMTGAELVRTFIWNNEKGSINQILFEQIISTLRCLRVLDLRGSKIEEIPRSIGKLKLLRYLSLSNNIYIKALPVSMWKMLNLEALDLSGTRQLEDLPRDIGRLINLRYLSLTVQGRYLFPEGIMESGYPPSLRILHVLRCNELKSLFFEEDSDDVLGKGIGFLTQLRELRIIRCPKLSSLLSNSLVHLTKLKELQIVDCELLNWQVELPPRQGETTPTGLQSLESLLVRGVPKLAGLPDRLEAAALSLRYLDIDGCGGLTSLPNWLKNCRSLLSLILRSCPKVSTLLHEVLPALSALKHLEIESCPNLSLSCEEEDIKRWSPSISHVQIARM